MPKRTESIYYRNNLRRCRLEALIVSQAKLARLTGICRTTICALENNRIPLSIQHALLIKRVLCCSLDDLYEEIPNGHTKSKAD